MDSKALFQKSTSRYYSRANKGVWIISDHIPLQSPYNFCSNTVSPAASSNFLRSVHYAGRKP